MRPFRFIRHISIVRKLAIVAATVVSALLGLLPGTLAAQDIAQGVIYVCNGERVFVENCNIRDLSDTSRCMVGHPDHVMSNGLMQYTYQTRGELKKLFPTCKQPTAQQMAAAQAFQKRQQDLYNANAQRAENQLNAAPQQSAQAGGYGAPQKPRTPEERTMNRCITSGRLPASCTGNSLLAGFGQMLAQVLPGADKQPQPGPVMAGVFAGGGNWRLDFIDGGVLVNCSFLSPNQESYRLDFKTGHTLLIIDTTPKPLVLTIRSDGTISGPGPVTINGVVAGGYTPGTSSPGHNETSTYTTTERMSANQVQPESSNTTNTYAGGGAYDVTTTHTSNNYVAGSSTPGYTNFVPKRATCPALNLHSTGAAGIQTMQTDLLKNMFGGDKGPPTPAGIRMRGIFAASTGFSVEFFPESAILGCGPDAARAYPYTVAANGSGPVVKIGAPDHPLTLAFRSDGSLDPGGGGPYQVHGRSIVGENDDGDFTFAPLEQTCGLAVLTPSKEIPSSGGVAATLVAATASNGAPSAGIATPAAPLGNAILVIASGLPAQAGAPNALAGHPYVLLRDNYADALAKGGVSVPSGVSPYVYVAQTCTARTPDCQKIITAINSSAASAVRADANGGGAFPGVPPGTYYLMVSARYNNRPVVWGQAVQLRPGPNSVTLDLSNATPLN